MPPVSITAEKTPAASENHRGRTLGRSLSGHDSGSGSRVDITSPRRAEDQGPPMGLRGRSAGIPGAMRVVEGRLVPCAGEGRSGPLRVRTCREPRRRAGHSRQIPPMRFPTEARSEYPSSRSRSACPIVQVRPIPRSRDSPPLDGCPRFPTGGPWPVFARCLEPLYGSKSATRSQPERPQIVVRECAGGANHSRHRSQGRLARWDLHAS